MLGVASHVPTIICGDNFALRCLRLLAHRHRAAAALSPRATGNHVGTAHNCIVHHTKIILPASQLGQSRRFCRPARCPLAAQLRKSSGRLAIDQGVAGATTESGGGLIPAPPFVFAFNGTAPFSGSTTRTGWTAGGGIEGALVNNWTWKVEYLYVDLGSLDVFVAGPFVPETINVHTRFTDSIVRAGLNLRLY